MLKLNEKVVVSEITPVLENEQSGIFLISAPTGEALEIFIEEGRAKIFRSLYLEKGRRTDLLWTIIKVGELS